MCPVLQSNIQDTVAFLHSIGYVIIKYVVVDYDEIQEIITHITRVVWAG
jgi:hypothetical protein